MRPLTHKAPSTLLLSMLLAFSAGCNNKSADEKVLREQTRVMMIVEAQQGFNDLFKASFNPEKAQLLIGAALTQKLKEKNKSTNLVPQEIRTAIANGEGVGLLIDDALPGKKGGSFGVIYMRAPSFGIRRYFLKLDPDPCGDGNPATCDFCTGCSGESSPGGIIHTCVCTESCNDCRPCPNC